MGDLRVRRAGREPGARWVRRVVVLAIADGIHRIGRRSSWRRKGSPSPVAVRQGEAEARPLALGCTSFHKAAVDVARVKGLASA